MFSLLIVFVSLLASAYVFEDPPNVLVFVTDDWGWGDLGANMDQERQIFESKTPFMDEFAQSSIRFSDFHSASAICTPSRAATLTGRLGLRTGTTKLFGPESVGGLPTTEIPLSTLFKTKNYTTFAIGKWHLGHHGEYHPNERDFDHYLGVPYSLDQGCLDYTGYILPPRRSCNQEFSNYFVGLPLYKNRDIIEQPLDIRNLSRRYVDEFRTRIKAVKIKNARFFGYIPFSHLHVPLGFDPNYSNITDSIFGDTLRELDDSFKAMTEALKSEDLFDNTLIWLFGDNGPWEMECQYAGIPGPFQGLWQKYQGGGGTTWKTTVWEGGHRVPGIVSWPRVITQGHVSDSIISALDILPTLSNLVGFDLPSDRHYDGVDVSDVLLFNKHRSDEVLYHPKSDGVNGDITAIRYKDYKAIYESGNRPSLGGCHTRSAPIMSHDPPLLFNLIDDPAEESPLDTALLKYRKVVDKINALKSEKLADIATDFKSTVDETTDPAVTPCCNPNNVKCRC